MFRTSVILSWILTTMLIKNFCSGSLLLIDRKNPCRAYGNASVFDITNLVKQWPIGINGPGFGGEYTYWWSCAGNTKMCEDPDVAVCQERIDSPIPKWNAGNLAPQLWYGVFNGAAFQPQIAWDIVYPNHQQDPALIDGTGIRVTVVHFIVDPTIEHPTFTVDGELKYTEYSITVRGKCIGQPAVNETSFVHGYCDPQTGQVVPGPWGDEIMKLFPNIRAKRF